MLSKNGLFRPILALGKLIFLKNLCKTHKWLITRYTYVQSVNCLNTQQGKQVC